MKNVQNPGPAGPSIPASEARGAYNEIVYTYPDGSIDRVITSGVFRVGEGSAPEKAPTARAAGKRSEGANEARSMNRARAKLRRLALANGFDYFVTLTIAPGEALDRYNGAAVVRALGRWCDNMVRRHGLRYILVPELHGDGALHFHGFMGGSGLEAVDSGVRWDGRPVYNLPQWPYGFTTAQRLYGDYHAAVAYCCKYIGKQSAQRPCGRWYYSGGALAEPLKQYGEADFQAAMENCLVMGPLPPGQRMARPPISNTKIGTILVQNGLKGAQNNGKWENDTEPDNPGAGLPGEAAGHGAIAPGNSAV